MDKIRWGVYGTRLLHIMVLHRNAVGDIQSNNHALCRTSLFDGLDISGHEADYQRIAYRKCKRCLQMYEKEITDTPKCTYTQPII